MAQQNIHFVFISNLVIHRIFASESFPKTQTHIFILVIRKTISLGINLKIETTKDKHNCLFGLCIETNRF